MDNELQMNTDICSINENNLEAVLFNDYGNESFIVTSDINNGLSSLEGALCYDESTNELVYVNMIQPIVNNSDNISTSQSAFSNLNSSIPSLTDLSIFNEGQFMLLANGSIVIPNDEDNMAMSNVLQYVLNPSESDSTEKHVVSVNSKLVNQNLHDTNNIDIVKEIEEIKDNAVNIKNSTNEYSEKSLESVTFRDNNSTTLIHSNDTIISDNKYFKSKKRYYCKLCSEKFSLLKEYKMHLMNHHKDKMYKCMYCGNSFNKQKNLILHEAIHNTKDTVCPLASCQKKFKRLASLKAHIKLHEEEDALTCPKCGEEFLNQLYLELHYKYQLQCRITTPEQADKSLQCKLCDRKFEFISQFLMHKKEHAKIKKALATKNRKKKTISSAPSSRMNRCKMCPKWFLKPSQLIRHMRIHTGERPFECTVCNKAFNQANSLKTHMLKHTGDRPYNCPFCSTGFSQRGNLRQHINRVHSIPKVEEHVYECVECSCIFKKLCSLNAHKNRIHQKRHNAQNENSIPEEAENSIIIENGLEDLQDEDFNELLEKKNYINTITVTLNRENGNVWNQQVFINKKGNNRYYRCSHCPKQSLKLKEIIRHLKFNILGRPFKCDHCSITFSQHSTFLTHLTLHANTKTFRCDICLKNFCTQSELKLHSAIHEKSNEQQVSTTCFKTYSQNEIANNECVPLLQNVDENTELPINNVNPAILDVGNEKENEVTLMIPSNVCKFCNVTYDNPVELKKHLYTHNRHPCEICNLLFLNKKKFEDHIASVHEKELKNFACDKCDKIFKTKHTLDTHFKSHNRTVTTENQFNCSYCSKMYKDEVSLKRHMKRMHKIENQFVSENFDGTDTVTLNSSYDTEVFGRETCAVETKTIQSQKIDFITGLASSNNNIPLHNDTSRFIESDICKINVNNSINVDNSTSHEPLSNSSNEITMETKNMPSELLNIDSLGDCFFDIQTNDVTMVETETETDSLSSAFCLPGAIIYRCTKCFTQYVTELDLQKHFQESEACNNGMSNVVSSYFYACNTCFLTFKSLPSFLRHLQTHDGTKSFTCLHCGAPNKTQAELTQHIAQHALNNEYPCIHCGELSDSAESVKKHITDIHLMSSAENKKTDAKRRKNVGSELLLSEKEKKMLACQKPNKYSSISEKVLSSLLKSSCEKDQYNGSNNSSAFENQDVSKVKKKTSSTYVSKENTCSYCGRGFKKMSDLVRHIRTHTGEKPFKCNYCNKCFRVKSILNCHLKTHFTVNNIFCHICNRFFSTVSSLKIHMRLHTGDRPYKCLYCKETFRTSGHRDSHQKRHVGDRNKAKTGQNSESIMIEIVTLDEAINLPETQYGLPEMTVGENFKLQDINLVNLQISTDVKLSNSCSVCHKTFKKQSDLNQHMSIHLPDRLFVCTICNVKFNQLDSLKMHLRLHNVKTNSLIQSDKSFISPKNIKIDKILPHVEPLLPLPNKNDAQSRIECNDIIEADSNQWTEQNDLNLSNLIDKQMILKKNDGISDFYVMDKQFDLNYMMQELFPDDEK